VVCPKCGEPLCAYSRSEKAQAAKQAKAEKIKGMAREAVGEKAPRGSDSADGPDGSDGMRHLPAVEPFPIWVFPEPLQRYLQEVTKALVGVPLDFVAACMLAVASGAIGNSRKIEIKSTWRESAAIWVALVGPPGDGKTPAQEIVSKPVEEKQAALEVAFRAKWAAYREALAAYEETRKRAKKAPAPTAKKTTPAKSGNLEESLDISAGVLKSLERFDRPQQPILERVFTSDTTVEALSPILAQNPRGLPLIRDELTAWTRSMDAYRNGRGADRQYYLSIWAGRAIVIDRRVNKDGLPIIIPTPFLTVCGGLVPDCLEELADERGRSDGFIDRVLFVYPNSPGYVQWTEDTLSPEAEATWRSTLDRLYALQQDREKGRQVPKIVGVTLAAKRAWKDFFNRHGREATESDFPAGLRGAWLKFRRYCLRFALLLHELRFAAGEIPSDEAVDDLSMRNAITLVEYFASHAARVYTAMVAKPKPNPQDTPLSQAILRLVVANGSLWQGTAQQLWQALEQYREKEVKPNQWPGSPESVGRAIRRLAKLLEEQEGIRVDFDRTKDKERTKLIVLKKLSEPSEPSGGDAKPDGSGTCEPDGSGENNGPTVRTVRDGAEDRTVRTVDPEPPEEPSATQEQAGEDVTERSDSSDGSDGFCPDDPEIEEGEL
jgi:hypothetical protein